MFILHVDILLFQHHLLKTLLSNCFFQKLIGHKYKGLFLDPQNCSIDLYVYPCVSNNLFWLLQLILSFKIRKWKLSNFFLFQKILAIPCFWISCFPGGSVGKEYACNTGDTGDMGLISDLGKSPGGGEGNPLQ